MENKNLSVLGAGFACLDIIRVQNNEFMMLGGTAANVVSFLSILGIDTRFLIAKYSGRSGKYMENAFEKRGIECLYFAKTKIQAPKIVEEINEGKHIFGTTCPKCGKNIAKYSLPSLGQINKIAQQNIKKPNVFFFDRISEGIKEFAMKNGIGWNVYEPNSCRIYSNLLNGIRVANIVKYSEERISARVTDNILVDIKDTQVSLLIVTMGKQGIKYVYRMENQEFSDWNYIPAISADGVVDSSGSGDWLTAVFLYLLIKKYPVYTDCLDGQYLQQSLKNAQKYATRNCMYIGAQGMLKDQSMVEKINSELGGDMQSICDSAVIWEYDCNYCFNENLK